MQWGGYRSETGGAIKLEYSQRSALTFTKIPSPPLLSSLSQPCCCDLTNVTKQQAGTAGALSARVQPVASRLSEISPDTYQVCFISCMAIKCDDTPQQWFTDKHFQLPLLQPLPPLLPLLHPLLPCPALILLNHSSGTSHSLRAGAASQRHIPSKKKIKSLNCARST